MILTYAKIWILMKNNRSLFEESLLANNSCDAALPSLEEVEVLSYN